MDSRLRRSPPDRASAVPYGQAGENAMRFPHLAHRSAAAHKLHSTPQQNRMNFDFGESANQQPALSKHPGPSHISDWQAILGDIQPRTGNQFSAYLSGAHYNVDENTEVAG